MRLWPEYFLIGLKRDPSAVIARRGTRRGNPVPKHRPFRVALDCFALAAQALAQRVARNGEVEVCDSV